MNSLVVKSPAKINLGLNVINKRDDSYHNIETIFYPLLLEDEINFEKSNKYSLTTNSDILNSIKSNLIEKAIKLLEKLTTQKLNVKIYANKNIPIGAGLGGGSSNAAITLKAMNTLYNLNLSKNQLDELAINLGSDVPFFLNPFPSFAESRGELLRAINLSISYPILLVYPGINISTKWAFNKIIPKNPSSSLKDIIFETKHDIGLFNKKITNDFEPIIFEEFPEIKEVKLKLLQLGAEFALMTGTGSSVFGIFNSLQKAHLAEEFFKLKYFTFLNYPLTKGSIT